MNDKCAGRHRRGDRQDQRQAPHPRRPALRAWATTGSSSIRWPGKCGVFAETDINGLQKQGVPPDELMASLFEAIVMQNLSVLTRGNTLRPHVLLLGGPNTYIRGMVEGWQHNIPQIWEEREDAAARRRAAGGSDPGAGERAVLRGDRRRASSARPRSSTVGVYQGWTSSPSYIDGRTREEKAASRARAAAWSRTRRSSAIFRERYRSASRSRPRTFAPGEVVRGFVGLDGGSTSTKAVLHGSTSASSWPRPTSSRRATRSRTRMEIVRPAPGAGGEPGRDRSRSSGVGTTGYAKDILKDALAADVALVETVAHTESALHYYDDVGRDLRRRRAGHQGHRAQARPGQGLQAQHPVLGGQRLLPAVAPPRASASRSSSSPTSPSRAKAMPAVRLRLRGLHAVRHRRLPAAGLGGRGDHGRARHRAAEEHLALRRADPEPGAARAATSCSRAARSTTWRRSRRRWTSSRARFHGAGEKPQRLGAQARRRVRARSAPRSRRCASTRTAHRTQLHRARRRSAQIAYQTTRSEDTRCYFCKNKCLRTFIDVKTGAAPGAAAGVAIADRRRAAAREQGAARRSARSASSSPPARRARSRTSPTCARSRRGSTRSRPRTRTCSRSRGARGLQATGLSRWWPIRSRRRAWLRSARERAAKLERRAVAPHRHAARPQHVLNGAASSPATSRASASPTENIVFSDFTSRAALQGRRQARLDRPVLPVEGRHPARAQPALSRRTQKRPLDYIFFPMIDGLPSPLVRHARAHRACPTVAATPGGGQGGIHQGGRLSSPSTASATSTHS